VVLSKEQSKKIGKKERQLNGPAIGIGSGTPDL
jgi:hypothetical protein